MNIGIELDQEQVCILIYADDIVFFIVFLLIAIIVFAKKEQELQCILNLIREWGRKWHVKFNIAKSNVVHFRKPNIPQTEYNFKIGHLIISVVDRYMYLGVILNDTIEL